MILANTHLFPLFSFMQQSSDQSDIPFWIIPTIIFAALLLIVVLSIVDEIDEEDAAHDAHEAEEANEPVTETKGGVLDLKEVDEETAEKAAATEKAAAEKAAAEKAAAEKAAAEKTAAEKAAAEKAAAEKAAAEKAAAETKEVVPDNLRKIEGIGPKIAGVLNDDGIFTFAQLAAATVPHLEKVVREDAGIRVAYPDTWPEQAQLAADGKSDELKTLQDSLKGGRRV